MFRLYSCKFPLVGTRNNVKRTQDGYVARQPAAQVDTLPSVIPQVIRHVLYDIILSIFKIDIITLDSFIL